VASRGFDDLVTERSARRAGTAVARDPMEAAKFPDDSELTG
jgi:hypothetical protein